MDSIRKSRAGIEYATPISTVGGHIVSGQSTSDGRVYEKTVHGNFVRVG